MPTKKKPSMKARRSVKDQIARVRIELAKGRGERATRAMRQYAVFYRWAGQDVVVYVVTWSMDRVVPLVVQWVLMHAPHAMGAVMTQPIRPMEGTGPMMVESVRVVSGSFAEVQHA